MEHVHYMCTISGKLVDPFDLKAKDVDIIDIAHSLSHLCRFAGHIKEFYSVAQHSVRVANACPVEHRLEALLHDATEAYLVDLPRPIKVRLKNYQETEERAWTVIAKRFDLMQKIPDCIKQADYAALSTESGELMNRPLDCYIALKAKNKLLPPERPMNPLEARLRFLEYYKMYRRN